MHKKNRLTKSIAKEPWAIQAMCAGTLGGPGMLLFYVAPRKRKKGKKACPLLQVINASWTPRKWGSRDDGFKQGQL
jgi:hypothetical protein